MPEPHTGRLMRDAFAVFERELLRGLHAADADTLRTTHQAVLRYLDADTGTRASTLAERSGLTRQALTQIVDDLEKLGYVVRRPDPQDRRAKLIVYTDKGRAAFDAARRIIDGIEHDWRARLGDDAYESLRASLRVLAED